MKAAVGMKNSAVIWQEVADDGLMPEPAILIEPLYDVIQIQQEGRWINLNYETVKELCKHLKDIKKPS